MLKQFEVTIKLSDFISHSGQTADPRNQYSKALKELSGKRKKVEADHEAMADIEFEAGLYLNRDKVPVIPGRLFESFIAEGARKSKEGKLALSGLFVDNDAVFAYDGGPLTLEQLKASDAHRLCVAVKIGTSKVMRTRPIFENVQATFRVSLETEIANPDQLKKWVEDGLNLVGLGDWRPRHGRGNLISFVEVAVPVLKAA